MTSEERVSLKDVSNMIYHTFLDNTSYRNPVYLVYCSWQLISNKDMKRAEKGEMTNQEGVRTCLGILCNSFGGWRINQTEIRERFLLCLLAVFV